MAADTVPTVAGTAVITLHHLSGGIDTAPTRVTIRVTRLATPARAILGDRGFHFPSVAVAITPVTVVDTADTDTAVAATADTDAEDSVADSAGDIITTISQSECGSCRASRPLRSPVFFAPPAGEFVIMIRKQVITTTLQLTAYTGTNHPRNTYLLY